MNFFEFLERSQQREQSEQEKLGELTKLKTLRVLVAGQIPGVQKSNPWVSLHQIPTMLLDHERAVFIKLLLLWCVCLESKGVMT